MQEDEYIPRWLQEWIDTARDAWLRGDTLAVSLEEAYALAHGDQEPVQKAKGITPRRRKDGVAYEVRFRGQSLGTVATFEEAKALYDDAKASS